mmetsp:Transcript_11326/g.24824  ORF Transcript_11326/g.24824 Transcript_11326/m.24824 type:complete len:344 (+) Transcript_11326:151-1182(+)
MPPGKVLASAGSAGSAGSASSASSANAARTEPATSGPTAMHADWMERPRPAARALRSAGLARLRRVATLEKASWFVSCCSATTPTKRTNWIAGSPGRSGLSRPIHGGAAFRKTRTSRVARSVRRLPRRFSTSGTRFSCRPRTATPNAAQACPMVFGDHCRPPRETGRMHHIALSSWAMTMAVTTRACTASTRRKRRRLRRAFADGDLAAPLAPGASRRSPSLPRARPLDTSSATRVEVATASFPFWSSLPPLPSTSAHGGASFGLVSGARRPSSRASSSPTSSCGAGARSLLAARGLPSSRAGVSSHPDSSASSSVSEITVEARSSTVEARSKGSGSSVDASL